jgi:hypothetical protein
MSGLLRYTVYGEEVVCVEIHGQLPCFVADVRFIRDNRIETCLVFTG